MSAKHIIAEHAKQASVGPSPMGSASNQFGFQMLRKIMGKINNVLYKISFMQISIGFSSVICFTYRYSAGGDSAEEKQAQVDSVLISPFSISVALLMTANGTDEKLDSFKVTLFAY